ASYVWSTQKEPISIGLLRTGTNTVMFAPPAKGIKYKVRNVSVVLEYGSADSGSHISSVMSGDKLYLKGFVNTGVIDEGSVLIDGASADVYSGEFEKTVDVTPDMRN